MKRIAALMLLCVATVCGHTQDDLIITRGTITQAQVLEAQRQIAAGNQVLKLMQNNTATLKVGEFMVVKREDTINGELLWMFSDFTKQQVALNSVPYIKRHDVPANVAVHIHMRRAGDKEVKTWEFPPSPKPWTWIEGVLDGAATLSVLASADSGKSPILVSSNKIVVGSPEPQPDPSPKPPTPKPDDPVVPVAGLRVVFVYGTLSKMTKEQVYILASPRIEEYLTAKCTKDEKGRPAFRTWGSNVEAELDTPSWKNLWSSLKPKLGQLPQICIVSNLNGEVFALPENEEKTLELLRRYGGK